MAKFWIERTSQDTEDRVKGPRAIGRALWANSKSTNGEHLLKINEGDQIIHIVDERIKHISVVKSKIVSDIKGLKNHKVWDENCSCYLLALWEPTNINNVFSKEDYLNKNDSELLKLISDTTTTFYSKNLSFKPNQFITPCSKELLSHFYWKFFDLYNKPLPGISKQYIHDVSTDLMSYINNNLSKILKENQNIRNVSSTEKTHNDIVTELKKGFINNLNFNEDEVLELLPTIGGGDIDLLVAHEETAIIIEVKARKSSTDLFTNIKTFYGRMEEYENFIISNPKHFIKKYKKFKFIFVPYNFDVDQLNKLKTKMIDQGYSKINLNDGSNAERNFNILHKNTIRDLFFELGKEINEDYAKREFLKNLFIEPIKTNRIDIPAIETEYKDYKLYTFTCSAKKLTQFATVSRKYIGATTYKSYQRRLNGKRLKSISSFIDDGNNFVNNIIIKFNENAVEFVEYEYEEEENYTTVTNIKTGVLRVTPLFHSCFVIDGQHRLFSFLKTDKDINIPVSALVGINERDEVNFFININDKAESVSADLIWDLHGDMKTDKSEGIISNAVKMLCKSKDENSIFYKNIKIPSLETGGFSFSGLCKTLHSKLKIMNQNWNHLRDNKTKVENPLYDLDHIKLTAKIYRELNNFFKNINDNLNYELKYISNQKKNKKYLFDGTIVEIICRIFKYFHIYKLSNNIPINDFTFDIANIFNSYSSDKIKDIKQKTGTTGKVETEKNIILELNKKYKNIGPLYKDELLDDIITLYQEELADWVNFQLTSYNEEWKNGLWLKEFFQTNNNSKYNQFRKDSNHDGRPIHQLVGWDEYKEIILSKGKFQRFNMFDKIFNEILFIEPRNGFTSETDFMNCFEQIGKYRNMADAHGKKDNWTEDKKGKVKRFYNQLKSLLV